MVDGLHFEKRYGSILFTPRCDKVKINEYKNSKYKWKNLTVSKKVCKDDSN